MGKWDSDSEEEGPSKKVAKVAAESQAAPEALLASPPHAAPALPEKAAAAPVEAADEEFHDALLHGCRSVENYEHINFIDQGTYGMVFKARCKATGVVYALKQVKVASKESNKVGFPITALREINILLSLRHPNIVRVREMVTGSSSDKVFMVMEYCQMDLKACMQQQQQQSGGSSLQPFSTAEVKQLMLQLLGAMAYMHSKWYVHRDLKTSNLLYTSPGRLTVCDFGLARTYGSPLAPLTAEVVTLWYRCPELLLGCGLYSTALDVWSVGCIFGEMLTGKPMLPGEGEVDQLSKIFSLLGAPTEVRWPGVTTLPNFAALSATISRAPSRPRLKEVFCAAATGGGGVGGGSMTRGVQLTDAGVSLMADLLELDPAKRIAAEDALGCPWLQTELPGPTLPDRMPRFETKA